MGHEVCEGILRSNIKAWHAEGIFGKHEFIKTGVASPLRLRKEGKARNWEKTFKQYMSHKVLVPNMKTAL